MRLPTLSFFLQVATSTFLRVIAFFSPSEPARHLGLVTSPILLVIISWGQLPGSALSRFSSSFQLRLCIYQSLVKIAMMLDDVLPSSDAPTNKRFPPLCVQTLIVPRHWNPVWISSGPCHWSAPLVRLTIDLVSQWFGIPIISNAPEKV